MILNPEIQANMGRAGHQLKSMDAALKAFPSI